MEKLNSRIASVFCLFLSLLYVPASGAAVQFGAAVPAEIKGVHLASSVKLDEKTELKRVTQGLRQKKIVFAWVSVYVAQFFSNAPVDVASVAKLKESLEKGLPVAVSMTFVRNVGIEKIVDGFTDVFKENGIDVKTAPFSDYLAAVKNAGDVKDGQSLFFVFQKNKDKESFRAETNGKEFFAVKDGAAGTISKFMNMWLGKPVDSGLEQLQEQVLKPEAK